ncbi:HAMP domain-containing histidine kinase [Francisellaceae bacterium]|nr:HAMP domain-containing histidine kinase [Francisellaceae bacterium]
MNINIRKVRKGQSIRIGIIILGILVFLQVAYSVYCVYLGVLNEKQVHIVEAGKGINFADIHNLVDEYFGLPKVIDDEEYADDTRSFAFFSVTPMCSETGIPAVLEKSKQPVSICISYKGYNQQHWLNLVRFSEYDLNAPLSFSFIIVILASIFFLTVTLIRLKWVVPFYEFQRYAFGLGMQLKAQPLSINSNPIAHKTAETFNFMYDKVNNTLEYQNKLLAMVCHDIRTPLTRMQARRLGNMDALSGKDEKDILEINEMLDNLIAFSKDNWLEGIAFELTNVTDFFEELIASYEDNGIRLINQLEDDIELNLKVSAFKRAICNLINNARKHAGIVQVILNCDDKYFHIEVKDNGTGIPQDEIENVFKAFYTGSSKKKGSGLGLAIVKEILSVHQGSITLENNQEGGLSVKVEIILS